jgi:hypothetical protein
MQTEEYVAMGGLITIIAAALALIIKQLEASRCTNIRCCGLTCDRSVPAAGGDEEDPPRP